MSKTNAFEHAEWNDFQILSQLTQSPSGSVFKARFRGTGQLVILKKKLTSELGKEHSILHEVNILNSLDDPNIIRCYGWFWDRDSSSLVIVLEFAVSGDLSTLIDRKARRKEKFTEDEIWTIFHQVCCGVAHIHEKGIIHRDLKSQNIFIDGEGHYKIGDFGIGRVLSKQTDFVSTFSHGTPLCMSPELLENKPYNTKTDVWALGVILYEMTTLKYPFMGQTLYELLYKIVHGTYEPVMTHHGYSKHLIKLIDGLLVKDFHRRPTVQHILEYMETIGKIRKKSFSRTHSEPEKKDDSSISRSDERYRLLSRESVASSSVPSSIQLPEGKVEDDPVLVFDTPRTDMESFWAEVERRRCQQPKQSSFDTEPSPAETKDDLVCLPHHGDQGSDGMSDTLVLSRHVSEGDVSSSGGSVRGHCGGIEVVRVFHKDSKPKRDEISSSLTPLPSNPEDHRKEDQPPTFTPPQQTLPSSLGDESVSVATKQEESIIKDVFEAGKAKTRGDTVAERDKRYLRRLQERRAKLRSQESLASCDSLHGVDDRKRTGVDHSSSKREKGIPEAPASSSTDDLGRPPRAPVASSSSLPVSSPTSKGPAPPPSRGFAGFVMGIGQAEAESVDEFRRPSTASSGLSSSRECMKDALFGRRVLEAEDSSSAARKMLERQRREKPDGEIVDQFGAGAELSMLRRDTRNSRSRSAERGPMHSSSHSKKRFNIISGEWE